MSFLLIDTDIASFILKGSNYADTYLPLLSGQELALSFMSVAELFQWAILRQWGDRTSKVSLDQCVGDEAIELWVGLH